VKVALTDIRYTDRGDAYLSNLAPRLVDAGHEVHVYCRAWDDSVDPRVTLHKIPNRWKRIEFLQTRSYDRWLGEKLDHDAFDLVHGLSGSSRQDITSDRTYDPLLEATPDRVLTEDVRKGLHRKEHEAIDERRFRPGGVQRVIALSKLAASRLQERYGLDDEQVVTIYNGVDGERFKPANVEAYRGEWRDRLVIEQEAFVILCMGHGFKRKGVETLIEAARSIRQRGGLPDGRRLRVAVVGADSQKVEHELADLCKEKGVWGDVKFYGPQELVTRFHAIADLFVLPTRFDRFGDSALEAMATGVPALVSAKAGVSELIAEGQSGYLLHDPSDAEVVADRILALAEDARLLDAMGRAARRVAEEHTWDAHVEKVTEVYAEVAALKRGRAAV
jgi:UDP-glucose:(heptosyl)LPS alpha-1,3-glucosyltransferase